MQGELYRPMALPIRFEDALAARERIRPHLQPTPLRSYEALDEEIGAGFRVCSECR